MKTCSYNLLNFFLIAFGVGSVVAFGDTIYNVAAGGYLTEGFRAVINFYAQNAIADSAFMISVGAFFASAVGVYALIRRKNGTSREKRWGFIFGPALTFLVLLTVAVPVNISALPNFMNPISLITNAIMLLIALALVVPVSLVCVSLAEFSGNRTVIGLAYGIIGVVALSIITGLVAFKPGGRIPAAEKIDGPNVIIITIDALRQDRVSAYDSGYVRTPHLDAFASRSIRFDEACANNPWTIPSMFTMLSSRYPTVHGADLTHVGNEDVVMLAEILKSHGYETEAYVANQILYGELGFKRGFDRYVEFGDIVPLLAFKRTTVYRFFKRIRDTVLPYYTNVEAKDSTEWLTDRLVSSVSGGRRPFFVWAHYLDPHTPLTPPREYVEGTPEFVDEAVRLGLLYSTDEENLTSDDRPWLVALYEAEVRYVDAQLKRVFDALEESGLYDNSIIVITADHGEEFFEHGRYGHGKTHYDEVVSIPLIIYVPGGEPGVSHYPASLVDVMPTVLDYVGADAPSDMSGESLLPALSGDALKTGDKFIFIDRTSTDRYLKSARLYPYTLTRSGPSDYTYDMRDNRVHSDPDDRVENPDNKLFDYYRTALDDWATETDAEAKTTGETAEIGIDAERREKLKGLGYIK
jgi:arylsulfatase A-like enzyme